MTLTDDTLGATVARVTRRRYGTLLQIFVELKRTDDTLDALDESALREALDRLVEEGRLDRDADAMYTIP